MADRIAARLDALVARHGLDGRARERLLRLLGVLTDDPQAPTTLRDRGRALDDHLADALVALDCAEVRSARSLADLGSGAGVPGLPLAIARPSAEVCLVEATERKCAFLRRVAGELGLERVTVERARAEELAARRPGAFDLVTARALASLPVVAEYAAPLLEIGGTLVAWRGDRDPQAELEAEGAALELGLTVGAVLRVKPYPAAAHRHLHLMSKVRETPDRFPRRPGVAVKRPLGRVAGGGQRGLRTP
jgi:16S rRNA (guanine527-N7)-methyltransferase